MIKLKKEDVPQDCGRFVPMPRDESYNLWDIADSEKLEYVGFIHPYYDIKECERTCNILNVVDYLFKELKDGDVE